MSYRALLGVFFAVALGNGVSAETGGVPEAVAALQRGDLGGAEQILTGVVRSHPNDVEALATLAVVLDQESNLPGADAIYRKALALSPRSPSLLNNYGNHLIAAGKPKDARAIFAKVLALDPAHSNALVQSSRLALEAKSPAEALRFLDRLPAAAGESDDIRILRMQALFALGRKADAEAVLASVSPSAERARLGKALASVGAYAQAENCFAAALLNKPNDFETLHNLGLASAHAAHPDRAREALQSALDLEPDNPDVLYDLAAVEANADHDESALRLLVHAAKVAPGRADVLRLLAHTAGELGYFGDAVQAWDRYLAVVPGDAAASRDRAFAMTALGDDANGGIAGLQAYVRKHPEDAVGHFELGAAEAPSDPQAAARELDLSLKLQPDLVAAHVARGLVQYRTGNNAAALADFEFAAKHDPSNPLILDRLGQTYLALDRAQDALPFLRKAAELAPRDSRMQLHLARALSATGAEADARQALARVRELGADKSATPRPAGLVDFLSLPAEEQLARYRAGVERTVEKNPDNAEAQVRYLQLLLSAGKIAEALTVAGRLQNLHPSAALANEAAEALIAAEQYPAAMSLLDSGGSGGGTSLNRAIASFYVSGAQAGLAALDNVPESARGGDYHLVRAQMLLAGGLDDRGELELALKNHPSRPDLFRQMALLLIAKHRTEDARRVLNLGINVLQESAELQTLETNIPH